MEVHRQLGCGFLEAVYQEGMELELAAQLVPFRPQPDVPIRCKGRVMKTLYRADVICFDAIIVELKALAQIGPVEEAQVINYLKATGCEIGFLLNFGRSSLQYKRYILNRADAADD